MQYFFFEKYLMQPDNFVYINASLMLVSSALFIKDLGPCLQYLHIWNRVISRTITPFGGLYGSYNFKWIDTLPIDMANAIA